ncbi:zinc finger MYM-type protein 1-like [Zingiber officinale]|uniref:zinc finger MYM-type protein 1-like n=1 Tax=Zingiber officinale TaxID=94328 RepID=UPI001C4C7257|nr:zinc finger MYM-type protein 1-like [Zingiber officinale]
MEHQSATKKGKTLISSFFKKRDRETSESTSIPTTMENQSSEGLLIPSVQISSISSPSKDHQSSSACIERDPGKIKPICEYHVNIRDEIRRSYLKMGPYQPDMLEYPTTKFGNQNRRFQKKWFQKFHWLEYSPSTNKAYCFYCFLFLNDINSSNISALVSEGFDNWKRVNQGKTCAFLAYIGSAASSPHTMSERRTENLMRPSQHIDNVMYIQAKEEKEKNRLRLKTSIVTVRWLALQGCAFRGNDESLSSSNRRNFLELVKAFAKMSTEINEVVLENAPKNGQYIAPEIQKDILHIMANRVRQMVREEVGDKFFCILVDEARDISKREQMAIILSVSDTTSLNLKKEISNVLVHHDLQVKKLRDQGYDGASNMRGACNGLQALFLRDCPYAYYVHCFAHRLQLTLVSVAKDVSVIWEFFSHLDNIVNIVTFSTKRIAELHTAQRNEIEHMLAIGERDSGSGANQIGNLQRARATRWSSHYDSVKSLIGMYAATCKVFEVLSDYSPNGRAKAEVRGIYKNMISFLMELNTRFNESSVEFLSLSTTLDPKYSFDSINSDDICKLAKKFYPEDFTNQDIVALEYELVHYKLDVMQNLKTSTLVELCQQLTESGRSKVYIMLTRLIHLVLTLPVSTATTERAFSAMKHVKTALRNKMEDDFLEDCLTLYIERDLAKDIDIDSIIDEFYVSKSRRAQLC